MAKIEKVKGSRPIELDKRQHVPYRVIDNCPKCGKVYKVDLTPKGDHHLSCPIAGALAEVYMMCPDDACGHEWEVQVIVNITVELVS